MYSCGFIALMMILQKKYPMVAIFHALFNAGYHSRNGGYGIDNRRTYSSCFWASVQGIMEEMAMDKGMKPPDPEWVVGLLR